MSDGPESLGEVGRQIASFRADTDRRFNALNTRLDKLVGAEVHQLSVNNINHRIDDLTRALAAERESRVKADADEERDRKEAVANEATARKGAASTVRMWVSGLVFAVLATFGTLVVTLIANASG